LVSAYRPTGRLRKANGAGDGWFISGGFGWNTTQIGKSGPFPLSAACALRRLSFCAATQVVDSLLEFDGLPAIALTAQWSRSTNWLGYLEI
jgi:hypothetical protein